MEINITNSYTEIYIGGGNFITENYPTYFPTFVTRRILLKGESADRFREVTAAQKAQLETEAAQWQRPPQIFIDLWNDACGSYGKYNEQTGYFELNGLTDITYAQAVAIYNKCLGTKNTRYLDSAFDWANIRTNLPFATLTHSEQGYYFSSACRASQLEVLNLELQNFPSRAFRILNFGDWMLATSSLRKVMGIIEFDKGAGRLTHFNGVGENLEDIKVINLSSSWLLNTARSLSLESFRFMISNATNTTEITLTVHPDVFAKLTGDTANAAAAALTPEELAAWMALPELAAEKNIQFALAEQF